MLSNIEKKSLVDVFLGRPMKKAKNPPDVISMDVPLFIRLLEFAREEAKNDIQIHNITEQVVNICSHGNTATMRHYQRIIK